jgi:hypothetical protein
LKIAACLFLAVFLLCPGWAEASPPPAAGRELTVAGPPLASPEQAVNFIKSVNPHPKLNCSVEEIVSLYYKEAGDEGIRPDAALSQALLETGFFRYGGAVESWQNNFCGLGSVSGGAKGASFATPELGVRAHIQHLLAYTGKRPPKTRIVDPRYGLAHSLYAGSCQTWDDLDGRWAQRGIPYGERIRAIYQRMLAAPPGYRAPPADKRPRPAEAKPEGKKEKHGKARADRPGHGRQ